MQKHQDCLKNTNEGSENCIFENFMARSERIDLNLII